MKKIKIKPGCIACGACAFIAPDVFEVINVSCIKVGTDIEKHKDIILKAIAACPVGVISYETSVKEKKI